MYKFLGCFLLVKIIFILNTTAPALAQGNSYLNFGVADGLPSVEIYQVIKDRNGFIWFGTDNGVIRFDGGRFEVFNLEKGLVDPVIFGLHEDESGRIWFRSFTGKLSYYKDGIIYEYNFNHLITKLTQNAIITSLQFDKENNLWMAIMDEFVKIDPKGNILRVKADTNAIEMMEPVPGKFIFAHDVATNKVTKFKTLEKTFPITHSQNLRSSENIFYVRWNDKTYLNINNDLYAYDGETFNKVYIAPPTTLITSIYVDTENHLWIGLMNEGLIKFDTPDFSQMTRINEMNDQSVTGIIQDNEGGYWITTLEKGVYYFPNFSAQQYKIQSRSKITSARATKNATITTDFSGIITAFRAKTGEVWWRKDLKFPIISAFVDNENRIWVSTNEQTMILEENGDLFKGNLPANMIDYSISGNDVVGITNYGYFKIDNNGRVSNMKKPPLQYRNLLIVDDEIYMGGKNGLYVYDTDFNFKKELLDFSDVKVSKVTRLNDSLLLISTMGSGFYILNKKNAETRNYNLNNNFIANNIYAAAIQNKTLWLGTEKGIIECNIFDLISGKPEFRFITRNNGLVDNKVNFITIQDKELWAFSDEGFVKFPIASMKYSNKYPVAYLKELMVNNKPVSFQSSFNLDYNENNIFIRVGFLSFNNQNILTRFRLAESEKTWTISEDWSYAFNSLSPGKYKFEIEYSTDNFNWQPVELNIQFEIRRPWWNSIYFYILLLVLAGLVALNLYQRRVYRYKERDNYLSVINEQQKKLLTAEIEATERERTRIANDLHDGISTDLISINLMLKRVSNKLDKADAEEIETHLNNTIAEVKSIIYDLTPPGLQFFGLSAGVQNYVTLLEKNSQTKINFEFSGEEIKDPHTGGMIFRIIQELLTNSIKHSACSEIKIQIATAPDLLTLKYADDGVGFNLLEAKKGLGLSSIQSRVDLLGGRLNFYKKSPGIAYQIFIPLNNYKRIS